MEVQKTMMELINKADVIYEIQQAFGTSEEDGLEFAINNLPTVEKVDWIGWYNRRPSEIEIKNMPEIHRDYVVARSVVDAESMEHEYWYYGSWNQETEAYKQAESICGQVFYRG